MTPDERTILSERQKTEILQIIADRNFKFIGKPTIEEPSEVSYKINKPIDRVIVVKRSILSYSMYLLYLPVIFILIQLTPYSFLSAWIYGCFLFLAFVLTYALIGDLKIVKTIAIYENGISGGDITIPWSDISGIYITHYGGRSTIDILWLALKDGTYQEFNISSYPYSDIGHTIAHYIHAYDPMGYIP
jgi:hypothetical protein